MTSILFGPKRSVYCPHAVGEFVFCKGDPNAEWPGTTWERHDEGVYLVAAGGTYRTGGRYGENAHALTAAELPWHAHALLCNLASGSSMSGSSSSKAPVPPGGASSTTRRTTGTTCPWRRTGLTTTCRCRWRCRCGSEPGDAWLPLGYNHRP
nr:MAG TPA: Baseplate structural protein [Caudoviricetes sp.]